MFNKPYIYCRLALVWVNQILSPIILAAGIIAVLGWSACNSTDPHAIAPRQEEADSAVVEPSRNFNKPDTPVVTKEYLTGQFNPANHPSFSEIPLHLASRGGLYLRTEALEAFTRLHRAAATEGHKLLILSATRNFDYQKSIWNAKWNGDRLLSDGTNAALDIADPVNRALRILEYSAMPGTSRHHWGTDIDINALDNAYFETGDGAELFAWLKENAETYGFCRPYTAFGEGRHEGYNEEKWHWSYYPLASGFLKAARSQLANEHISGFPGGGTATSIDVVRRYVFGVSDRCR